jgi:hypothetical protein
MYGQKSFSAACETANAPWRDALALPALRNALIVGMGLQVPMALKQSTTVMNSVFSSVHFSISAH